MIHAIGKTKRLSPSEALYGFAGWLTTRETPTRMSSYDHAGPIAELIDKFCKENDLEEPRYGWEKALIHPKD